MASFPWASSASNATAVVEPELRKRGPSRGPWLLGSISATKKGRPSAFLSFFAQVPIECSELVVDGFYFLRRHVEELRRPGQRSRQSGVSRRPTDPRPGLLQAAGSDLTSVIGRGLRSPSLSTCRPSATARSAAATILTRSAFVGVSGSGPSSTPGGPPFAGRPRN